MSKMTGGEREGGERERDSVAVGIKQNMVFAPQANPAAKNTIQVRGTKVMTQTQIHKEAK